MSFLDDFKSKLKQASENKPKNQYVAHEYQGTRETRRRFYIEATSREEAARKCQKQLISEGKVATLVPNGHAVRVKEYSYLITRVVATETS